jgi:voltage-gated potassium channel
MRNATAKQGEKPTATPPEHDRRGLSRFRHPGALERFEQRTAWPMMGVVVASLALLLAPVFFNFPPALRNLFVFFEWLLWLVFAAEYATRWYIAIDRMTFVKHNVVDLAVVVLPMVPALRALRLARLGRIAVVGARVIDQSDSIVKRSNAKYAVMLAGLIILLAAIMAWSVEHENPQSSIHSLNDALWWAVTTVTTVGYGDKYPVSPEGKAIAIGLMLLGIAVFGLVSATLASMFVENSVESESDEMRAQLTRVEAKLDALLAAKRDV